MIPPACLRVKSANALNSDSIILFFVPFAALPVFAPSVERAVPSLLPPTPRARARACFALAHYHGGLRRECTAGTRERHPGLSTIKLCVHNVQLCVQLYELSLIHCIPTSDMELYFDHSGMCIVWRGGLS